MDAQVLGLQIRLPALLDDHVFERVLAVYLFQILFLSLECNVVTPELEHDHGFL
jgi:hypothetical protein